MLELTSIEDTSRSQTGNRATNNQGIRIWSNTTEKTSELEESDTCHVCPFCVEESVDATEE